MPFRGRIEDVESVFHPGFDSRHINKSFIMSFIHYSDMPELYPQANFTEAVANCTFVLPKSMENSVKNSTRKSNRIKLKMDLSLKKSFDPLSMTKQRNTERRKIVIREFRFSTKCSKSYDKLTSNGEIMHIISLAPLVSKPRLPGKKKVQSGIVSSTTTMASPPSSASIGTQTEMVDSNDPTLGELFPLNFIMEDEVMKELFQEVSDDYNNPDFVPCCNGDCAFCLSFDKISCETNASGKEITKKSEKAHKSNVVIGEDTTQKEENSQTDSLVTNTQREDGADVCEIEIISIPRLDLKEGNRDVIFDKTTNLQPADKVIFDEFPKGEVIYIENTEKHHLNKDSEVIFEEITKNSEMAHNNSVVCGKDTKQKEENSQTDSLVTNTQREDDNVVCEISSIPLLDLTEENGDVIFDKTINLQHADNDVIFDEIPIDEVIFIENIEKQHLSKDSGVIFEEEIIILDDIRMEKEIICLD